MVDGEVVALDDSGKPDFRLLQEYRKQASRIHYFIFDLLVCEGRDLTGMELSKRREFLQRFARPLDRLRISEQFEVSASDMLSAVRAQKLEGVVAKRKDSVYQAGQRTGARSKYRVNRSQELVIGGYIPGPHGLDSLIVGYYRGDDLMYVARVRNGFVPTPPPGVRANPRPRLTQDAFREPAGEGALALGRRSHRRKDEAVRMGATGSCGADRIH